MFLCLTLRSVKLYNFQQRISWLSHRWRTQRTAIRNVNCRIQWIIESLNAPCAARFSEGHVCLSVTLIYHLPSLVEWTWTVLSLVRRLVSKCIVACRVLREARPDETVWYLYLRWSSWFHDAAPGVLWAYNGEECFSKDSPIYILRLTSNQMGLPAELKHINKRRKRN